MSEDYEYIVMFYNSDAEYKVINNLEIKFFNGATWTYSDNLDRLIDYCNTPCYRYQVEDNGL